MEVHVHCQVTNFIFTNNKKDKLYVFFKIFKFRKQKSQLGR